MAENERQERLLEQLQEDERLRGDLEDDAASALLNWASDKARAASDDPQRTDAEVESDLQLIRSSARTAARSGASDPQQVIAQAEGAWTLARGKSPVLAQQAPRDGELVAPQATLVAAPPTSATPAVDVAPPAQGVAAIARAEQAASTAAPPPATLPPHRKHHPSGQWLSKIRSWTRRLKI